MMKFTKSYMLFAGLTLTFHSCALLNNMKTEDNQFPIFSYEGHRGARGLYPENTIGAMKTAIDIEKVTTLEMDCHITKDNRVIVYHDHYLNPNFIQYGNGKALTEKDANKLIYQYTYEELSKFDIGSKYYELFPLQKKEKEKITLLSDLIRETENYAREKGRAPMFYNIETKSEDGKDRQYHPIPQDFVDLILQIVIDQGIAQRTVIQSFDKRTIQYLNKIYPQIKTSYLVDRDHKTSIEDIIEELGFTPYIISPHHTMVNKNFVKEAHKRKIKIIPWTVNEVNEISALKKLGIDGIISDYPNLF